MRHSAPSDLDYLDHLNGPYAPRTIRKCQDCGERHESTDDSPVFLCGLCLQRRIFQQSERDERERQAREREQVTR